ncbi:MAG: 4-hydroxy-tetrahydrodipicolinate synthase [Kiritimatiellae bacterium]|nr:4-hydroxy-tetrahydrodipicolinate synthase [Kiritimatiellia bacterium]
MFPGAYTAIVTPFNKKGEIDYQKLRELIERQIKGGIDGIVPVGTTGESPVLNYDEHRKVIEISIEVCRKRIKVIAGTGANSTREAVELTRFAAAAGADGTLQVAPYYNKPNQEGLARHFLEVAEVGLPVVLYNIPGRTGVEIAVETVARLAQHPKITTLKEAGGNVARVSRILDQCEIDVLSGDDPLTLPMMSIGAKGVISVAANIAPEAVVKMVRAALEANWAEAISLHRRYFRLFSDVFLDTNPIPVKAGLAMLGLIEEEYRLPLSPMDGKLKDKLAACLRELNLM